MNDSIISPQAGFGYIPGLNGIRAVSVLIVLIAHMGLEHIIPGGFGVTIFFFISGFLITRLLIAETITKGRIGLRQFYIRRFIRLYPALLFMVFATVAIYSGFHWGGPTPLELFSAVFYGTNIYQVVTRIGGEFPFMPWTHLWSLAVEEHFYLLFPASIILLGTNWNRMLKALSGLLVLILIWRSIILTQTTLPVSDYSYMMTDTRIDSIIWGCVLSILLHVKPDRNWLKRLGGYMPVAIAVAVILLSFLIRNDTFRYTIRFSLQGLALFILFYNLFFTLKFKWAISILEWPPLAWIGTISYALYLWHVPIFDICKRILGEQPVTYICALALSFAVAAFSYHIVETRFIALRKRFGSHGINKPARGA